MATFVLIRLPNGELQAMVDAEAGTLTEEQAKEIDRAMMAAIGRSVPIVVTQEPEGHKSDQRHVHVIDRATVAR